MKSSILKNDKIILNEDIKYPCLMINNKYTFVVLFRAYKTGVVVSKDIDYPLGFNSCYWDMDEFILFSGAIALSN